jgi:hypothetical protein
MNDGVSAAFLALGLQTLCCAVLMWGFSRKGETPGLWRIVLCSLLLPPTAIAMDFAVGGFLREGSLLFIGVLFALLLHTLGKLRIFAAFGAVFCLFSLSLGTAVFHDNRRFHSDTAEEERLLQQGFDAQDSSANEADSLPNELLDSRLDQRLLVARNHLFDFIYADDSPLESPPATPTPSPALVAATPQPTPKTEDPEPSYVPGENFALLFLDTPAESPTDEPTALHTPSPVASPTRRPEKRGENVVNVDAIPSITAEQLTQMAKVRNISIDRRFPAPVFEVGLIGIGDAGSYAMVNGTVIRIGSILRSPGSTPAAWKLVKVSATELYWQPME